MENKSLRDIKVGDTVLLVYHPQRGTGWQKEVTVSKVGRKYFQISDNDNLYYTRYQFHLENGSEKSDFTTQFSIYLNQQELDDINEVRILNDFFKSVFRTYGNTGLSLECLREMKKVYDFYQPIKKE